MFENVGNYKCYKIDIQLMDILNPYWNLFINIKGLDFIKNLSFSNYNEELKTIKERIANEQSPMDESFIQSISNQTFILLKKDIATHIYTKDNIEKSFKKGFIAVFKDDDSLLAITNGCDYNGVEKAIKNLLENSDPILLALKILNRESDETQLKQMVNHGLYELAANQTRLNSVIKDLYAPFYHRDAFEIPDESFKELTIEDNAYWINIDLIKKYLKVPANAFDDLKLYYIGENESSLSEAYGIALSDFVIPLQSDFDKHYTQNIKAYWENFKWGVYREKEDKPDNKVKPNKQFLVLTEKEPVTNKLSFLEDNLFLFNTTEDQLGSLKDYFHTVSIIDSLNELDNYQFFSTQQADKTFLGIHKKDKAGSKSYKLAHYIVDKDSKLKNYRGGTTSSINSKQVKVLKPDIAFYYLMRYFEDFFENALHKITTSYPELDFVTDYKVTKDGSKNEIDVIAFNGKQIFFIELKTNLNTENVISYQEKCNKWLEFNKEIAENMKFAIIGCYGKRSLNICINQNVDKDGLYNTPREGLNGCAYDFEVPIHNEKTLKCFTESSYQKLQTKIIEVLNLG